MPTSTLKINGSTIDRDAADVVIESLLYGNPEGPDVLEFTQHCTTSQAYLQRSSVELLIDDGGGGGSVRRFYGRITGASPDASGGISWKYRAEGGSYLADLVSVSHPQRGTGESPVYNAPPDDLDYDAGLVGLSMGDILTELLTVDEIATDLWNAGVEAYTAAPPYDTAGATPPVLKAATVADFALMTIVPLEAIRFSGQRLWSQVMDFVRSHAPTFRLRIRPDGTIRCTDTRTLTPRTLTVGTDAIRPPTLARAGGDCVTAIRVRGRDDVEAWWFSLVSGDLEEDWTAQEEADWTWDDFARPAQGYAACTITAQGTNTVTVSVDDGLDEWGADYWPGILAHVTLIDDAASGAITYQITRRIIANTALSSGGTSTLTLDVDLPAGSAYDRAEIVGIPAGSHVHRRYKFASTRQDAAARIVRRFPFPVATGDLGLGYQGAARTSRPFGWNVKASSGFNVGQPFILQFSIYTDPDDNLVKIITAEPTIAPWTLPADRDIGGNAVTKPDDIRVLAPVSKGPLEIRVPAADDAPPWEGRAYTIHGLEFELVLDLDGWLYIGDESRATTFAQDLLDSLKDPVITGAVEVIGFDADALDAGGIESIELETAAGFDALDDDLVGVPLPVQSVELRWNTAPGSATNFTTVVNLSNRTFPYHGGRDEPKGDAPGNYQDFGDFLGSSGLFTDPNAGGGF